ncbi:MAG TPA: hypothetical protein VNT75_03785 [Symbiobacteriaceae bacterium]|nr:hypothetical protein [Symbiobacteriaceae bacterium]
MGTSRHSDACTMTAYQRVGVNAEVTITPSVECGPITVACLETKTVPPGKHRHCGKPSGDGKRCKVQVYQELWVAVPITFRAQAVCRVEEILCGPATTDPGHCLPSDLSDSSCSDSSSSSGSDSSTSCSDSSSSSSDCSGTTSDSSGQWCDED